MTPWPHTIFMCYTFWILCFKVLKEHLDTNAPCPALPKPNHIARSVNRHREQLTPDDHKALEFELHMESIPENFLRGDIKVNNRRHLVFASASYLDNDGTFKLVRDPFTQLLSINAFVRADEWAKQLPLVFVVMSGRTTDDYVAVNISLKYV